MSDYITRKEAMIYINVVFTELNTVERQLSIRPLSESESELGEILELINVFIVKLDKNYHDAVKFLSNDGFIQYYGKICQLAEALKLDIYKEIKNKTKLKALDKEKKRYYYYVYHYEGNNTVTYDIELTESGRQMEHLVTAVHNGFSPSTLRDEIRAQSTNLEELFEMEEDFMNEGLRDFLNLRDDRSDYTLPELTAEGSEWKEMISFGSGYHNTKTNDKIYDPEKIEWMEKTNMDLVSTYDKIYALDIPDKEMIYRKMGVARKERLLNAKFTHDDGREVVIDPKGKVVDTYPDKGTYNYVNGEWYNSIGSGGHKKWDMNQYNKLMKEKEEEVKPRVNVFDGFSGNRKNWPKREK